MSSDATVRGGTGCRRGHVPTRSPAVHPELGMVPSRTSAWIGLVLWVVVIVPSVLWLPPAVYRWLLVVLTAMLATTGLIQLALGHRGRCWRRRTLRWTFGVVGQLIDPFDSD